MKWEDHVRASEHLLKSGHVPSSTEIISLIKRVNPTSLALVHTDKERGYAIKHRLQSLLLENYGEAFNLVPHPVSPNIILIKHRALPSIDACHARIGSLSTAAVQRVETAPPLIKEKEEPPRPQGKGRRETKPADSPSEVLKEAQRLLDEFEYADAEETLAALRATTNGDVPVLARGAALMLQEMGAYHRCIDMLLSQSKAILKDKSIRETLAVAYHHIGSFPEARAILDELHPGELGLEGIFAYADIAFRDGNLFTARELVRIGNEKEGFLSGWAPLQKEIEAALDAKAGPLGEKARTLFDAGDLEQAKQFAREALEIYPHSQQARSVVAAIEAIDDGTRLAELWAKLDNEPSGERRIALLTTLLEEDRDNKEKIRKLIGEEKGRQRREIFDTQLAAIKTHLAQQSWPECFDRLSFLMKQPEFLERAGEVIPLSPFFSLLQDNKRTAAAGERAKEPWLRFVRAKTALAAGNPEGCYEVYEELKPWFGTSAEFKADYRRLRQAEQEKARKEIAELVEKSGSPECQAGETRAIYGSIKKRMTVLPPEERQELVRIMEERLASLLPERDGSQLLLHFREALRLGLSERVAYLRSEIADPVATGAVDAEFAEAYRIDHEPVTLEFSDDLPIDLTTRPPLGIYLIGEDRIFLKDGQNSLVMIDFARQGACRVTSPVFARTEGSETLSDGTMLFHETVDEDLVGDLMWRAEIDLDRARFTANFGMREAFEIDDAFDVRGVSLSSERDTDYYVIVEHYEERAPARLVRKRLDPKGTVQTVSMGQRPTFRVYRRSSHPDSFVIAGEDVMETVNRNLSVKDGINGEAKVYRIDTKNGNIYTVQMNMLVKRGPGLDVLRVYTSAPCFGIYEPEHYHGISFVTEMSLVVLGNGRQVFYNLANNKHSQKIRVGRVIPHQEQGKWYCFDFDREKKKLWLRDITKVIETELKWREFFFTGKKTKRAQRLFQWFLDGDNYMYKPEEWVPPWDPSE
ncbi:hypothetical protein L4X63_16445 [Geomonas sp. Red32]|uniref:hypothetical protein n=1 Tax=Geomonas sp. Red32 TaxID=2912856 RepID=UPI00202CEB6A|nr:hypothetical protein [Geomonas sp. Red32]MCM0083176.1 hypothetical protein [Geomonas sp. Red32]